MADEELVWNLNHYARGVVGFAPNVSRPRANVYNFFFSLIDCGTCLCIALFVIFLVVSPRFPDQWCRLQERLAGLCSHIASLGARDEAD